MAGSPEYRFALQPEALRYFEAIEDRKLAAALFKSACERLRYADSCTEMETLAPRRE